MTAQLSIPPGWSTITIHLVGDTPLINPRPDTRLYAEAARRQSHSESKS